jgi:hypothetical protein
MKNHVLKTDPDVFAGIWGGTETHGIRFNDRDFQVGDKLTLQETKHTGYDMARGAPLEYTGRETWREISHIRTGYGLEDGWCILSFKLPLPVALFPAEPEPEKLDSSDREKLLYVARVLRSAADLGGGIPLGGLWSEILVSFGAIKRVLELSDEDVDAMNDPQLQRLPDDAKKAFLDLFISTCIDTPALRAAVTAWTKEGDGSFDSPLWSTAIKTLLTKMERSNLHPAISTMPPELAAQHMNGASPD